MTVTDRELCVRSEPKDADANLGAAQRHAEQPEVPQARIDAEADRCPVRCLVDVNDPGLLQVGKRIHAGASTPLEGWRGTGVDCGAIVAGDLEGDDLCEIVPE